MKGRQISGGGVPRRVMRNCSESSKGSTGLLKGKAGYMVPEYVDGQSIDRRVDVFGLGVVLWESLTGTRLFGARNQLQTLRQVVNGRIPPLSSVCPELGAGLSRVVAKALERSPGKRYQDAQQFGLSIAEEAETLGMLASHAEVGEHVHAAVEDVLKLRREVVEKAVSATTVAIETDEAWQEAPTREEVHPPLSRKRRRPIPTALRPDGQVAESIVHNHG